jgi:hypothetical protein
MLTKFAIVSCLAILLISAFTVHRNSVSKAHYEHLSPRSYPPQQSAIPDHVVYNSLFRKVVRLREKTKELQSQNGIEGRNYFPMQREAKLSEAQATALEAIAYACRQQITERDKKASAIIQAFKSQFPDGRVPEGGSPPPPPELRSLWEDRTAVILRARESLRTAFGEEEFARFDNFAKLYYGANTSEVTIDPIRPKRKFK